MKHEEEIKMMDRTIRWKCQEIDELKKLVEEKRIIINKLYEQIDFLQKVKK